MNKITLASILQKIGNIAMEDMLQLTVGDLIGMFGLNEGSESTRPTKATTPFPNFFALRERLVTIKDLSEINHQACYNVAHALGDNIVIATSLGSITIATTVRPSVLQIFMSEDLTTALAGGEGIPNLIDDSQLLTTIKDMSTTLHAFEERATAIKNSSQYFSDNLNTFWECVGHNPVELNQSNKHLIDDKVGAGLYATFTELNDKEVSRIIIVGTVFGNVGIKFTFTYGANGLGMRYSTHNPVELNEFIRSRMPNGVIVVDQEAIDILMMASSVGAEHSSAANSGWESFLRFAALREQATYKNATPHDVLRNAVPGNTASLSSMHSIYGPMELYIYVANGSYMFLTYCPALPAVGDASSAFRYYVTSNADMFLGAFNSHFSGWVPVASLADGTSFIDIFLNEAKRRMTTVPAIDPAMQVSHFSDAQRGATFEFINHSDMFTMLPGEDCKLYIENAPYKGLSVYGKATDENIQLLAYMQMDITGGPYEGWPKFFHRTLPLNEVAGWDNPPGENFEGWAPLTIPDGVSVTAFFYGEVEASMMHGAPPANVVVINPIDDKVGEGDGDNKTKPVILKTWGNMLHSRLNPGQESKPTAKVQEASTPAELVDHLKQAAKPSESQFFKSPVTEVKEAAQDALGELQEIRNDSLKNIAEISKIGGIDQIALDFIPDALLRTELEELLRVIPAVVSHFPLIPVEGDRRWSKYVDVKAKSLKVFVTIDGVQFVLMYQAGDVGIHMKSARTEAGFEPKDPLSPVLLVKAFVAAMGSGFVCSQIESVLPTFLAHLMDVLEQQK